jgi:tetratricopeptide (TPR) repeat protein
MAEEIDSTSSGKKRRVIHWNPDAGREQAARRWTWKRIAAWTVGGFFALLFAAGIVIRLARLVLGPDVFRPAATVAADGKVDANSAFVNQTNAEQLHEMVSKQLVELRRMPPDHPVQLQNMILIEKSYIEGEQLLASHEWRKAYAVLDTLQKDMKAFALNVKIKAEAKQAYDSILLRVRDLELARSLAPGVLEAAQESAGIGRQLLNDGNFVGAKKIFDEATVQLNKAQQALTEYVRENLVKGARALAKGEKDVAKQAFQAALEKSPGNEEANRGLKRAENIDRVFALLQQGEKLEKDKQYAAAAESYQKAFALDALSAEAQQGQARAERLEKETRFATAQAAADAAFKRRDWAKAIAEGENALKVYPKKAEVTAMLKAAKENAHKDAVANALAKAYAYENQHQWNEARRAYDETMKLEPENQDAKDGYMRAGTVIRALMQYEKLVDAAEQLANKAEFQAAKSRFNDAMNYKPTYLQPSDRVLQLQGLLQQQTQPVEVTFRSDGKTYVSIGAFKMLGQIEAQTVKIYPGDYHVVGRRKGYKDVDMMLQVRYGVTPPPITVMCNESQKG